MDEQRNATWLAELLLGLMIGFVWSVASLYLPIVLLWGTSPDPATSRFVEFVLRPGISILFLTLGLTTFRKERLVTGVLVAAIVFNVWMGLQWQRRASYAVQLSGKSYFSAAKEHFGHVWRGE